jgi:predicted PurR-regulated permease PerM
MKLFGSNKQVVQIQTETIFKIIALSAGAFLLYEFVGSVSHQLRLIGIAFFLAIALNPTVTWISSKMKSGNRILATGISYLVVLALLSGLIALVVPPLVQQTGQFIKDAPSTFDSFLAQDTVVSRFIGSLDLQDEVESFRDNFVSGAGDISRPIFNAAGRIGGTAISIITVLVLAFMMLIEGPFWFKRFLALQPASKREQRERVLKKMYSVVIGYVNGQVLVAATGALFALIALLIGNVVFQGSVNAIALAGIIFVFALLPMIGTTIGAVIVVFITLLVSLPYAITMAIFFIVYQQIENATFQPMIQSKTNQLTPLTVFVAALIGIGAGGLVGALAAIPIAGCIRVLMEEYYNSDVPTLSTIKEAK